MKVTASRHVKVIESTRTTQVRGMFDLDLAHSDDRRWDVDLPIEGKEWNIGLIVGPSGSGKTTIVSEAFGLPPAHDWPADRAVLDGFPEGTGIKDVTGALSAVGFSSPPAWLRPYRTLCVDPETEILTKDGWRRYDTVRVGDEALTLNHVSGVSEWQPIEAVNTYEVADAEMLHIEGRVHSSLTTRGHRWPVILVTTGERTWRRSGGRSHERLNTNHRMVTAAPCADVPTEAKWSDAFVETVAWFFTEGSLEKVGEAGRPVVPRPLSPGTSTFRGVHFDRARGKWAAVISVDGRNRFLGRFDTEQIAADAYEQAAGALRSPVHPDDTWKCAIHQSHKANPDKVVRIRKALTQWLGAPRDRLRRRDPEPHWREERRSGERVQDMTVFLLSSAAARALAAVAPVKCPSPAFVRSLTRSQLELFLTVARLGDGWMVGDTPMFAQSDSARLEGYELAIILSGRTPHRYSGCWVHNAPGGYRYEDKITEFCSSSERTTIRPIPSRHHQARSDGCRTAEWVRYTGVVWCPTTRNATWLARRNGHVYFTGNSNGEMFRVDLARSLVEAGDRPAVVDEFSSVVDRTVAQIGSAAVAKWVRRSGARFVAAACHYDIIDWLQPDWTFDLGGDGFSWRSLQQRPRVDIQIRRCSPSWWSVFRIHHYLSHSLAGSARCWLATVDGRPAAFISATHPPHPSPKTRNLWREHRTVVLPDFQGIGLGNAVSEYVASLYKGAGCRYHSVSSHPAMIRHRAKSPLWHMERKPGLVSPGHETATVKHVSSAERATSTFAYVGPPADPGEVSMLCPLDRLSIASKVTGKGKTTATIGRRVVRTAK